MRPDGDVRIVHERGQVVTDDSDKPVRVFGTTQDVTERGARRSSSASWSSRRRTRW